MRKILVGLISSLFVFGFLPSATSNTNVIYLISKPHQLFDGTFRNDDLAQDLLSTGRLGKSLEEKRKGTRTWVIDGHLLDEVADMANGYKLVSEKDPVGQLTAKEWLSRLLLVTSGDRVVALAYGNPDIDLARRSAPSELRSYYAYGAERVSFHLNRAIPVDSNTNWNTGKSQLSPVLRKKYTQSRQALTALSTVVKSDEVRAQRAKLAILLSPTLNKQDREFFSFNATEGVASTLNKLRVTSGKYQVTSQFGKVPVTVINGFDVPVKFNIDLTALNSRIQVTDISALTIPAKSRTQLALPFTVIAPGSTIILAQITNVDGGKIGTSARLSLNSTIFDSRVAWFTVGAAILLFIAALTQTIRRIRRGRNEKQ
jgi:hypothetical protein